LAVARSNMGLVLPDRRSLRTGSETTHVEAVPDLGGRSGLRRLKAPAGPKASIVYWKRGRANFEVHHRDPRWPLNVSDSAIACHFYLIYQYVIASEPGPRASSNPSGHPRPAM